MSGKGGRAGGPWTPARDCILLAGQPHLAVSAGTRTHASSAAQGLERDGEQAAAQSRARLTQAEQSEALAWQRPRAAPDHVLCCLKSPSDRHKAGPDGQRSRDLTLTVPLGHRRGAGFTEQNTGRNGKQSHFFAHKTLTYALRFSTFRRYICYEQKILSGST